MHRAVKAHPHHLRHAPRIVAVRLVDLCFSDRLLLMLEAANADLVFTISLKRSTLNLQLSTSWPADYLIYVKRHKNDAVDAEAICEAVTRTNMRFVATKTPEQQSCLTLHRTHQLVDPPVPLGNQCNPHVGLQGVAGCPTDIQSQVAAIGRAQLRKSPRELRLQCFPPQDRFRRMPSARRRAASDRPVVPAPQAAKRLSRRRAWRPTRAVVYPPLGFPQDMTSAQSQQRRCREDNDNNDLPWVEKPHRK